MVQKVIQNHILELSPLICPSVRGLIPLCKSSRSLMATFCTNSFPSLVYPMHIPSAKPPINFNPSLHHCEIELPSPNIRTVPTKKRIRYKGWVLMFPASSSQTKSGNLNILSKASQEMRSYTHLHFPKVKIEQQQISLLPMDKHAFTIWNIMMKKVLSHLWTTNMIQKHTF